MGSPRQFLSRFSVYGDLPNRLQDWGTRICPHFLEPVFVFLYTAALFPLLGPVRRGILKNLSILLPGTRTPGNLARAFTLLANFSTTLTDAGRCRNGQPAIDWEIEGHEHLAALAAEPGGAILLTAHMGSYDVAAAFFSDRLGRPLNAVRAPERDARTQDWMRRKLVEEPADGENAAAAPNRGVTVRYNAPDSLLGIDLVRALDRGEYVAIQGDRVLFEVSPVEVPFGADSRAPRLAIPKGPFVLALASRAPVYPLFVIRTGWRRYRIRVDAPFRCEAGSPRERDAAIRAAAARWVACLRPVVRRHWHQWFVLENAFRSGGAPDS